MKKIIFLIVAISIITTTFVGCHNTSNTNEESTTLNKPTITPENFFEPSPERYATRVDCNKITKDMSVKEVIGIIGKPQRDYDNPYTGMTYYNLIWDTEDGLGFSILMVADLQVIIETISEKGNIFRVLYTYDGS